MSDKEFFPAELQTAISARSAIKLANDALDPNSSSASADVLKLQCDFSRMGLGELKAMVSYIDLAHINHEPNVPVAEFEHKDGIPVAVIFEHTVDSDNPVRVDLRNVAGACDKVRDLDN